MVIAQLYVDGRIRPLGIDHQNPSLGWKFANSELRSQVQTAYRIIVSDAEQDVHNGVGKLWDSGKIMSRKSLSIPYAGQKLSSRMRYYWKVQAWDQNHVLHESEVSSWEMGLLYKHDWSASWIGHPTDDACTSMPLYRHEFQVEKTVSQARIYICGLGHYELRLNGSKVEDRVLEPGWTNYNQTCLYNVYDVTNELQVNSNAIGVILGNGFFHVPGGRYTKFKDSFGLPRCIVQLEIQYTDGSTATVVSNDEWLTASSPITFSCIYGGEDYDARLEQAGWDEPGFNPKEAWHCAALVDAPKGQLKAQKNPPLKVMQTFKPVNMQDFGSGRLIIDLGQNFSGWVRLSVKGAEGARIKVIPAEILNEEGRPSQKWSGSPHEYNYVLKGGIVENWSPRFSYYGFRYVEIEGVHNDETIANKLGLAHLVEIEGQMIYPDVETIGYFESSDRRMNQIHEIINWAILSNMKSVFTDCPHREKLGWLEQVHLVGPGVMYNYDVNALLSKVIEDVQDAQLESGLIPTTAPEYVVFTPPWDIFRHSVSWAATYILTPWYMYQKYGNTQILNDHYADMQRYIEFVTEQSDQYIVQDGLGDWYDVGEEGPGFAQNTPVPLVETAMYYHLVETMQYIADVLDKGEDRHYYAELQRKIKAAFNQTFFAADRGQYGTGSQASNAMALALGLVDEDRRAVVFDQLLVDIEQHDGHTTSGDVAHRFVLKTLAEAGRSDVIFGMLQKTDYPSYGYQIEHGATTLTEAWDGPTVGKSQNHFMLGHIEEWFYHSLAGLQYEMNPKTDAYEFTIKPYIDNPLRYVKAHQELPIGLARVEWEKKGLEDWTLEVEIPVNSSAVVHLPASVSSEILEDGKPLEESAGVQLLNEGTDSVVVQISSGTYRFLVRA